MSINDIKPDNRTEDEKLKSVLKLTSILLLICIITLISVLVSGCKTIQNRYDLAVRELPKGANLISVSNDHIRYQDTNNVTWIMFYDNYGNVYNVIDNDQIPAKK